jgi:hypothetical protein
MTAEAQSLFDGPEPESCGECSHALSRHSPVGRVLLCGYPGCSCGLPARPYADRQPPSVQGSATSEAAAQSQNKRLGPKQARILELIAESPDGRTDDELERMTGWIGSTVRPRRRELFLAGKVRDSGRQRKTSTGRSATVWVV